MSALWAGHSQFVTTQRYIRLAEAVCRGFGTPFPALPETLFGAQNGRKRDHIFDHASESSTIPASPAGHP